MYNISIPNGILAVYIWIFRKGKIINVLINYFFQSLFVSHDVLSVLCKIMITYAMNLHKTDLEQGMHFLPRPLHF